MPQKCIVNLEEMVQYTIYIVLLLLYSNPKEKGCYTISINTFNIFDSMKLIVQACFEHFDLKHIITYVIIITVCY